MTEHSEQLHEHAPPIQDELHEVIRTHDPIAVEIGGGIVGPPNEDERHEVIDIDLAIAVQVPNAEADLRIARKRIRLREAFGNFINPHNLHLVRELAKVQRVVRSPLESYASPTHQVLKLRFVADNTDNGCRQHEPLAAPRGKSLVSRLVDVGHE